LLVAGSWWFSPEATTNQQHSNQQQTKKPAIARGLFIAASGNDQ